MAMLRTPTLLLALALTSACASSGGAGADADAAVETPQSSGKAEQAAVDLRIAELELKSARAKAEGDVEGARRGVLKAEAELAKAERSLAAFEAGVSLRIEEKELALARSVGRADDAKLELAELEAMYAEEEFAEMTKELVIQRGRRAVELSDRALTLERAKLSELRENTLPKERGSLQVAVENARRSLEGAREKVTQAELSVELSLARAEAKVSKARKALEELE